MKKSSAVRLLICLPLLLIGLIVLAWPEENNLMMVQFSKSHGPSGLDLVGIGIIMIGYFPLVIPVFTKFHQIQKFIGTALANSLAVSVIVFSILIAASLVVESELLLWLSVAFSAAAQGVLVFAAFSKTKSITLQ